MGRRLRLRRRGLKRDVPGAEALRVRRTRDGELYERDLVSPMMGKDPVGTFAGSQILERFMRLFSLAAQERQLTDGAVSSCRSP